MKPINIMALVAQFERIEEYNMTVAKETKVLAQTSEHPDTIGFQWAGVSVRSECFVDAADRFIEAVDKTIKAAEAVR